MRDGILKRKLNFTCNYRSSGAHGSVKRHFIPKPPCIAGAPSPERHMETERRGREENRERKKLSSATKMALSRCSDERKAAAWDVTGK